MISKDMIFALGREHIAYIEDIPLSRHSSFRIGGVGELGVFPKSREELILCLSRAWRCQTPFYVIGKGSNILFGDGRLRGIFIFTERLSGIEIKDGHINAESGATLAAAAARAAEHSLTGLEFARGIPGSIGGAVFMNAGAFGGQMSDVVAASTAFNCESGELLSLSEHEFSYRESIYINDPRLICISAELKLSEGDPAEIAEKMRDLSERRRQKQPLELPSAGSYFKRPEGSFAGKLIEDCGLKGLRVGSAAVSEKHAGFIVNLGSATASEVLELESRVIDAVYKKFGVILEREVRVIR